MRKFLSTSVAAAVALTAAAHEGDVGILVEGGRLVTGLADDVTGEVIPGERIFAAELGLTIPGFADEPGFYALPGTLPGGALIGFDIRAAVRVWDGADFDQVGPESITFESPDGLQLVTTPGADPLTPIGGLRFAMPDAGALDDHPNVYLNPPSATGIYLAELELATSAAGLTPSLPFWIVFNSGLSEEEHDLAIEYVEQYILPAPGAAGVLAMAGLFAARRRR